MSLLLARSYERLRAYVPDLRRPMPPERAAEAGETLLPLLKAHPENTALCRDVVNVLGDMKYDKAIPVLIELALDEKTDSTLKRACVNNLRHFEIAQSIKAFMSFLGVHLSPHDKWVRQLAAQNLTTLIRRLRRDNPAEARRHVDALRNVHLNAANTYTRMNTAVVLRLLGDRDAIPLLEARLKKERALMKMADAGTGIPFVAREIERTLQVLRDPASAMGAKDTAPGKDEENDGEGEEA
jgi:HEAT repeat protein